MSRAGRVVPLVMAGVLLPAAVAFLVVSVVHLVGSATTYHVRVLNPPAGTAPPTTAEAARLAADQNHWGVLAMFAVAAVAAALVLSLVTWMLSWQQSMTARR